VDFKGAKRFLESLIDYEKKPGYPRSLEGFREFLAEFDNPHEKLPPTILIVGTKGKGSTAAFLTAGLMSKGFKVGTYTSPHLVDIRERITINFEKIPEEKFAALVQRIAPALGNRRGIRTFFESLTLMAFLHFLDEKVDYVILEAGLGGRLDATNVVDQSATVITPIDYDHTEILGNTLMEIAREKSAVIKSGNPVFSAPQEPEVSEVIKKRAGKFDAPLYFLNGSARIWGDKVSLTGSEYSFAFKGSERKLMVPLLGRYQIYNSALAALALEGVGLDGFDFESTVLRGRLEVLTENPFVVVDGAHNPFSMRVAFDSLEELFPFEKLFLVLGISSNKDLRRIMDVVDSRACALIATRARNPRAMDPWLIAETAEDYRISKIRVSSEPEKALEIALKMASPRDLVFVTGSFYLAGDILKYWESRQAS